MRIIKRKSLVIMMTLGLLAFAGQSVNAQTPRQEYPRPQFERHDWVNLNGTWTYSFDFGKTGREKNWQNKDRFDGQITVPFCPESKLSGVQYTDFINSIWYQRRLSVPSAWDGKRILLHFGAVDYETYVYIDGHQVGAHKGSGSSFCFDITPYVKAGKDCNLVVQVLDDLRGHKQTGGKQSERLKSHGCMYTRVTGIWQTVWMEPVDREGLRSVFAIPDIDQQQLVVHPRFYQENADNKLVVRLLDGEKKVSETSIVCANGGIAVLPVKNMKLWSPESPHLYNIVYEVKRGGKVIDRVQSYVGMRKVHIANGYFYLNNKPYFQRLVLDQGFYPDGIWTAPSDEALRHDIEMSKAVGFNGARLHQKSFEERYYYWADKLGYLTWGESASWGLDVNDEEAARNFLGEWTELVERDRNHPSLVTWTPFNETWDSNGSGVYNRLMEDAYRLTYAIDGTRPVNDSSGDGHVMTDIWSVHNYKRDPQQLIADFTFTPGKEPYRNQPDKTYLAHYAGQPYIVDEFGGLPWIKESERSTSWGYGEQIKSLDDFYRFLQLEVDALKASKHVVGFCYTQITDVEQEKNGIYYYDRTPKFDTQLLKAIFESIPAYIENPPDLK
jgi:beta-galactosidase/beta-glucuronidase